LNAGNEGACPWHADEMYLKHVGMLTVTLLNSKKIKFRLGGRAIKLVLQVGKTD
jgi:hypothetical protein